MCVSYDTLLTHLLNLAELLVDTVVVVLHVHRRREYLVLEFLGEPVQAPVLGDTARVPYTREDKLEARGRGNG